MDSSKQNGGEIPRFLCKPVKMKDTFTKAVTPEDLTELSVEWIIHETGTHKKLTLIVNIIKGRNYIKYGVIRDGRCIFISTSRRKALIRYNLIPEPKTEVSVK